MRALIERSEWANRCRGRSWKSANAGPHRALPYRRRAIAAIAAGTRRSSPTLVALASCVGTSTEWYDFYIFGFGAAIVFPRVFFPTAGQSGILLSFAVFWVGFLARPIGGALFGHFGDRVGRKSMLIVALLLMGSGTCVLGVLPGYAQIGMWAPAALIALRFLQGIAVGGEWGGAALMATEHAPDGRRGLFGSFPQMGSPIGSILASSISAWVAHAYTVNGELTSEFFRFGWRIPFLASAILVAIGLVIRISVSESPAFERMRSNSAIVASPLRAALKSHWRTMLLAGGTLFAVNVGYLYGTQVTAYASGPNSLLHVPVSQVSAAVAIGGFAYLFSVAVAGWLCDRLGRRYVAMAGAALALVAAFPIYMLIDTAHFPAIVLAECIAYTSNGLLYGPLAAIYCEAFPANVRYTAASVAYHGAAMVGGLAPFLGTALLTYSHGRSWVLSLYIVVTACISLGSLIGLKYAAQPRNDLSQVSTPAYNR